MRSLLTPHITEKSYLGYGDTATGAATYIFLAVKSVDKEQAKKIVEKQFKVTVTDVRVINLPGKARRFRNMAGRTQKRHKVVVRLKKGDRIAAFETEKKQEKSEGNAE